MKSTLTRNRAGFTMIELAVVVTLIGVLSMIALPKYRHALERARATQAFSTLAHDPPPKNWSKLSGSPHL